MIPGSDLLGTALSLIGRQCFQYYKFQSRQEQPNGLDVASYFPPVEISGSVQPIPRNLYEQMGLDMQKTYFNFFVETDVLDVERNVSGDQFFFNGKTYQALSTTAWYGIDGWVQVLAVHVTNA